MLVARPSEYKQRMIPNRIYSPGQTKTEVIRCYFESEVADPATHESVVNFWALVRLRLARGLVGQFMMSIASTPGISDKK